MPQTSQPIETRLTIPAESVSDFERVMLAEHRPSIMNTAHRIFLLGLEEWTRREGQEARHG